jgi:hypothetical protein
MYKWTVHPTYCFFSSWYKNSLYLFSNKEYNTTVPPVEAEKVSEAETVITLTDKFIRQQKERLAATWNDTNESLQTKYNVNIDEVFYNKSALTELLSDEHNYLEKKWRTKILFMNTPRGNIVMWYDAYKLGFAYFSDQSMPYSILNAVAMKYVITFYCRDLFMDETAIENAPLSRICVRHKEDAAAAAAAAKTDETKKTPAEPGKSAAGSGPFAKFKSYNSVSSKVAHAKNNAAGANSDQQQCIDEKQMNRFIYLGKMYNMSFLQKPVAKPVNPHGLSISETTPSGIYSALLQPDSRSGTIQERKTSVGIGKLSGETHEASRIENVSGETAKPPEIPKQIRRYSDYKKWMEQQKSE